MRFDANSDANFATQSNAAIAIWDQANLDGAYTVVVGLDRNECIYRRWKYDDEAVRYAFRKLRTNVEGGGLTIVVPSTPLVNRVSLDTMEEAMLTRLSCMVTSLDPSALRQQYAVERHGRGTSNVQPVRPLAPIASISALAKGSSRCGEIRRLIHPLLTATPTNGALDREHEPQ